MRTIFFLSFMPMLFVCHSAPFAPELENGSEGSGFHGTLREGLNHPDEVLKFMTLIVPQVIDVIADRSNEFWESNQSQACPANSLAGPPGIPQVLDQPPEEQFLQYGAFGPRTFGIITAMYAHELNILLSEISALASRAIDQVQIEDEREKREFFRLVYGTDRPELVNLGGSARKIRTRRLYDFVNTRATFADVLLRPEGNYGRFSGWAMAYDMRGPGPGAVSAFGEWQPIVFPWMIPGQGPWVYLPQGNVFGPPVSAYAGYRRLAEVDGVTGGSDRLAVEIHALKIRWESEDGPLREKLLEAASQLKTLCFDDDVRFRLRQFLGLLHNCYSQETLQKLMVKLNGLANMLYFSLIDLQRSG